VGARGAFEFFATLPSSEPPQESAAKKSCDETPAAPQPGPQRTRRLARDGSVFGLEATRDANLTNGGKDFVDQPLLPPNA
jgi:hypothetical protein